MRRRPRSATGRRNRVPVCLVRLYGLGQRGQPCNHGRVRRHSVIPSVPTPTQRNAAHHTSHGPCRTTQKGRPTTAERRPTWRGSGRPSQSERTTTRPTSPACHSHDSHNVGTGTHPVAPPGATGDVIGNGTAGRGRRRAEGTEDGKNFLLHEAGGPAQRDAAQRIDTPTRSFRAPSWLCRDNLPGRVWGGEGHVCRPRRHRRTAEAALAGGIKPPRTTRTLPSPNATSHHTADLWISFFLGPSTGRASIHLTAAFFGACMATDWGKNWEDSRSIGSGAWGICAPFFPAAGSTLVTDTAGRQRGI